MYYYKTSNQGDGFYLYTVGCDTEDGWEPESDWDSSKEACDRVRFLNGGKIDSEPELIQRTTIAAQILSAMLSNPVIVQKGIKQVDLIDNAIDYADKLIKKLRS